MNAPNFWTMKELEGPALSWLWMLQLLQRPSGGKKNTGWAREKPRRNGGVFQLKHRRLFSGAVPPEVPSNGFISVYLSSA